MKQKTILQKDAGAAQGAAPVQGKALPSGGSFPDNYNGIPYSVIVNSLLAIFGFRDGIVPEGARNSTLYRLARQLRYICDFNPLYIRSVVPSWGLTEEEMNQT